MAALTRWFRLPSSPIENSAAARGFVFAGFAVAVAGVVLYGQDYAVPVAGLGIAAWGHVVSYRDRNLKRRFWRQALLAAAIFAALFYILADSALAFFGGVMPQANFAIFLVAITSFDLKTRRNCYSSLWMSLALMYLAAVYAWDYMFGVLLGLWTLCLAGFWMASHLQRISAEMRGPVRPLAVTMSAALVGGTALFIALPQPFAASPSPLVISLPNFNGFRGEMESSALPLVQLAGDATGASNSVDLHYRGRLGDAPVMYVRTGAPAYWRGLVFDTYKDGQWTASDHSYRELPPYVAPRLLGRAPHDNLGTFAQTFRVLRPLPGVLDAAYPVESIYAPVAALRLDGYGTFHTPQPLQAGQTYSAVSYIEDLRPDTLRGGDWTPLPDDVTGLSPRGKALASQVAGNLTDEYDIVMAIVTYLQSHYRYSLQLPAAPAGRDPVDWFLFDVKTGYCEQFASAAALMLRSLGVQTRLATGYATGDYDPVLDQAVVRERDAHAWVEALFPTAGWVPVDPTPGVDPLAATKFPNHWAAGGIARLLPHMTIGAPGAVLGTLGAFAVVPPAIAVAIVAVLGYAWLRRRSWKPRRRPARGESEVLRLYERVQRRFNRRRAPPETPLEYQQAMDSAALAEITHAVNEGVYADRWPEPRRVREIAARISSK